MKEVIRNWLHDIQKIDGHRPAMCSHSILAFLKGKMATRFILLAHLNMTSKMMIGLAWSPPPNRTDI